MQRNGRLAATINLVSCSSRHCFVAESVLTGHSRLWCGRLSPEGSLQEDPLAWLSESVLPGTSNPKSFSPSHDLAWVHRRDTTLDTLTEQPLHTAFTTASSPVTLVKYNHTASRGLPPPWDRDMVYQQRLESGIPGMERIRKCRGVATLHVEN